MNRCLICNKEYKNYLVNSGTFLCKKCSKILEPIYKSFTLDGYEGISIFKYSKEIKDIILNIKVNKDHALTKIFLNRIKSYLLLTYRGYVIVPIPSLYKDDKERGFNHVVEIFRQINLPIFPILFKNKNIKQAVNKNRSTISFGVKENILKKDAKILLVDDFITSGNSIKNSIKSLNLSGYNHIKILTLIYHLTDETKMRL